MNIQLLACVVVVADYVKLDGSLSDLQSQQVGLKRCNSEVKPKENRKEMQPQAFWGRRVRVGWVLARLRSSPFQGGMFLITLVCHHLGHLAFLVPGLKHLCSPSA